MTEIKKKRKRKPSKKLLRELMGVLKKHEFTGSEMGILMISSSHPTTAAATTLETVTGCPPGQVPYTYSFFDQFGNIVTKTICVPA